MSGSGEAAALGRDGDLPVPLDLLSRLGFREPEEAAAEIAELAETVFGPFDPERAEWWAAAKASKLRPQDLRHLLAEAVRADDPLAFVRPFGDARAMLGHRMRWRWSSRRARALGHPAGLDGQTWASLSEAARAEVREALRELSAHEARQVGRHRPKRHDLDTFLRELALIYTRRDGALHHPMTVPHSARSRFIQLAEAVLDRLPRRPTGEARVHPNLRTARGLSERWHKIKTHESPPPDGDEDLREDGTLLEGE